MSKILPINSSTAKVQATTAESCASQRPQQGFVRLNRSIRADYSLQEEQRHQRGRSTSYTNSEKSSVVFFANNQKLIYY
jgi:hypothetical protein